MHKCEMCQEEHDGTFGSGRFCSLSCSRKFSTFKKRKSINQKIAKTLREKERPDLVQSCKECGQEFQVKNRSGQYCSDECKDIWLNRFHQKRNDDDVWKTGGDLGEVSVIKDLVLRGLKVFAPISSRSRADLIAHDEEAGIAYLIQVKSTSIKNNVVSFPVTCLEGKRDGKRQSRRYTHNEVSTFAVYIQDWDEVVYIDNESIDANRTKFQMRCSPPRNGNKSYCSINDFRNIDFFNRGSGS
jgi:hypothetical protein